ncbi:MAG: hypothetical protein AB7P33_15395 [Dehalococcoidia bacterium]
MPAHQPFDPDRVAYFETEGWRAYYDRKWPRLLRLLVTMSHEQFRIPWPQAVVAAYYVTRASVAWVPVDHDDAKVLRFYEAFYGLARKYSGLNFDPKRVAELELKYNDDHRRLVDAEDKTELLQTLVDLHAALFGLSAEQVAESAAHRVAALNAVDRITSKRSTDVAADWREVLGELQRCYRSIAAVSSETR